MKNEYDYDCYKMNITLIGKMLKKNLERLGRRI